MTHSSRLLEKLDQALATSTDRIDVSRLLCRKAIHYARLDDTDRASELIVDARERLNNSLDPVSGMWILLAESFMAYFSHDLTRAFDRVNRAFLIASSAGLKQDLASASAWFAHIAMRRDDIPNATAHLKSSITLAGEQDHFTRCRSCIVAADMLDYANQAARARRWIRQARLHATAEGDESSIAAVLYNSAMHRLNFAMLADVFDEVIPEDFSFAGMELESSLAFDSAISGVGLPEVPENRLGHILVVKKEYEKAITVLTRTSVLKNFDWERALSLADIVYSAGQLGNIDIAKQYLELIDETSVRKMDADSVAFVFGRLAKHHKSIGNLETSTRLYKEAQTALAALKATQDSIVKLLKDLQDP